MDATKLQAIEDEIGAGLNLAANVAGAIDPALLPIIVIGKAAAAALPGLIDDVNRLISKAEPTADDIRALRDTIAGLDNPESL